MTAPRRSRSTAKRARKPDAIARAMALVVELERDQRRLRRAATEAVQLVKQIVDLRDSMSASKARHEKLVDELEGRHAALMQIEHRAAQSPQTKLH